MISWKFSFWLGIKRELLITTNFIIFYFRNNPVNHSMSGKAPLLSMNSYNGGCIASIFFLKFPFRTTGKLLVCVA